MVAAGFSGSNIIFPEIPVAVPEIDSRGASKRNKALLTFLGSLKSNSIGSELIVDTKQATKATHSTQPEKLLFIILINIFFKRE